MSMGGGSQETGEGPFVAAAPQFIGSRDYISQEYHAAFNEVMDRTGRTSNCR
jgi:hypothetical protein